MELYGFVRVGHALGRLWADQVDHQLQLSFSYTFDLHNADPAHFHFAADGLRCRCHEPGALTREPYLIVGDQEGGFEGGWSAPGKVEKAQGKIGLAGPGRPSQQGGRTPERDARAVDELRCVGQEAVFP